MKCVTSLWLFSLIVTVASALRVPSSWDEKLDFETYKTKLRKTRQKPVVERKIGGFTQTNNKLKSMDPKEINVRENVSRVSVVDNPLAGDYQVKNNWGLKPEPSQIHYGLPLETERRNYEAKNTVINEEVPTHQKLRNTKAKSSKNYKKAMNHLAEADLIRQLERHKMVQDNLATIDRSPGKLRAIYLKDQLNRNAMNHNQYPIIHPSEVTFTTIVPEVTQISERSFKANPIESRPSVIKENNYDTKQKSAEFSGISKEEKENILATNHRDDELHEPHKDSSERDDSLHEPINDKDTEKISDNEDEADTPQSDRDVENTSSSKQDSNDEEADEEDATSDEENEESDEEPVGSEQANPDNIPTKPIYPGEGQWARPGRRYRPHISPHRFFALESHPQEKKPEGYDIFEDLTKFFENQRANFERQGQFSPEVLPTSKPLTFDEQLQAELPTPPTNIWRPNILHYVNPVNPIIVYDPFDEQSAHQKNTLVYSPQKSPIQGPKQAQRQEEIGENSRISKEKSKIDTTKEKVKLEDDTEVEVEEESKHKEKRDEEAAKDEDNEDTAKSSDEENGEDYEGENEEEEIDPESSLSVEEEVDGDDDDDFTPMQLYTQVRHSANVEHLPPDPEENGRLKEVIKDSKVQTVYTEEGYEDLAYDHAGHEKKAESEEGLAEFEKNKEEKGKIAKDSSAKQSGKTETLDSLPSDTGYIKDKVKDIILEQAVRKPATKTQNTNNFLSTKQIKTTELKDIGDGKLQMETQSKIKTIMQPNNSDTAESVLTVYPKIYQDVEEDTSEEDTNTTILDLSVTLNNENHRNLSIPFNATFLQLNEIKSNLNNTRNVSEAKQTKDDDYWDESLATESYANSDDSTEAYFNPETDNFNVEDISVKSLADIFSKMKVKNRSEPAGLSEKIQTGISPLNKIDDEFQKSFVALKRGKRGSGFLDVNVDTDFILHINHTLPPKPPKYDAHKYSYYKDPSIPENSPLRYAENMQNIPEKIGGRLSFYEKAEEMECPELDVPDPIPDHVKNKANNQHDDYEDAESGEKPGTPKAPRIEIGSKIKCYKRRYFGDQPLDSPFFKEEFVGKVKPIFKDLMRKSDSLSGDALRESTVIDTVDKANEILNQIDKNIKEKYSTELKNKEFALLNKQETQVLITPEQNIAQSQTTQPSVQLFASNTLLKPKSTSNNLINSFASNIKSTSAPITSTLSITIPESNIKADPLFNENSNVLPLPALITTPKYTLKLKPKNIYDQITLLDHLDTSGTEILRFPESDFDTMPIEANRRESKELKEEDGNNNSTLEAQPLRRRKYRPHYATPNYHVILSRRGSTTTTPFPIIDTRPTTVLPKYKVISEVFYKDEIQPNEQLAVFSDILNNIRNASKREEQVQSTSNFAEPSTVTVSSIKANNKKRQPIRNRKRQEDNLSHTKLVSPNHKTSTFRPFSQNIVKLLEHKGSKHNTQKQNLSGVPRWKIYSTTTTRRPNEIIRKKSQPFTLDFIEETEEIVGLVPPDTENYNTIVLDNTIDKEDVTSSSVELPPEHLYQYKTIILPTSTEQLPAPVSEAMDEPIVIQLNKYLFLGLKPPKPQKVRPYTDYTVNNLLRRKDLGIHTRYKREAQRPAYSELSRNRGRQEEILEKPEIVEDDIDDYVPHRPRNYYYDEKTGKIVYLNNPKQQQTEEEKEIVEYEEITEARPPPKSTSPKPQTKLLLATAKPPAPGESFIDYLSKVKNDPSYKFIPDPTTTEKGSNLAIAQTTTLRPTISTNPPEFLDILAKIKSDSSYKVIEDPDRSKKKIATTTQAVEEALEEQDSQEDRMRGVQDKGGIFNIGGYLPEVKDYTPQTKIDYSKYKTINRGSNRQRPTPSNNEEKIDYTAIVRVRKPVYDDEETLTSSSSTTETQAVVRNREQNTQKAQISESRYHDVSDTRTTTSTQRPSSHILQNRRRPSKITTTTNRAEASEKSVEILAPPIQTRRGTRPTTLASETTPALEIQEPSTRIPTRRRRPTTPKGFQPSLELVRTTEAVVRVYPENQSVKRVYRRQPVHIKPKSIREDDDIEKRSKFVRRRSQSLSDVGQSTFLDPVQSKENDDPQVDREDRSIDESGKEENLNLPRNKQRDVETFKEFDKNKRHGGNYKQQKEESEQQEEEVYILIKPSQNSYKEKRQDGLTKQRSQALRSRNAVPRKQDVEVVQKIDESKKTGGNYKPEDEIVEEEVLSKDSETEVDNPDIAPENDKDASPVAPKSKRLIFNANKFSGNNPGTVEKPERLSDVVPKPDHFYTDPNLPKQINQIRDIKSPPRIDSEELEEIVTEGDHIYSRQVGDNPSKQMQDRLDVVEDSEEYGEEETLGAYEEERTEGPTEEPLFIKDPEKRLYYYAPV